MHDGARVREGVRRLVAAAGSGELDAVCRRLGIRLLGIFGSAARDADDEPGDLDVAVSFRGDPELLRLVDELTRISRCDQVDVTVIDDAEPVVRAEALVGIPLYEDEPGAYTVSQMAALAERRDTAWLRALQLELLAG